MLAFFIMFLIIGAILGFICKNQTTAIALIVIIAICWTFAAGVWGIVSFFEMLMGYRVISMIKGSANAKEE